MTSRYQWIANALLAEYGADAVSVSISGGAAKAGLAIAIRDANETPRYLLELASVLELVAADLRQRAHVVALELERKERKDFD